MSKALLKMSGIISIVFAGLYMFIFVMANLAIPYNYFADNMSDYMVLLVFAFLALTAAFGGMVFLHYKDLSDEELKNKKNSILGWSIILFITSNICGVLGLIVYILLSYNTNSGRGHKYSYIEEIRELEKLKDEGYITEDEFTRKKRKILDIEV